MPFVLLGMMAFMDRENVLYVSIFLILLFAYTGILIARILEAKKRWYLENKDLADLGEDNSIDTMGDITKKLDNK